MTNSAIPSSGNFDDVVEDAGNFPIAGWDLAPLRTHATMDPHPWDYLHEVTQRLDGVRSLLDLGTGDGELLASLSPRPHKVVATEGYAPMIPIATARLSPLGIEVVAIADDSWDALPFDAGSFDAIIDARAYYSAREVARLLAPGGWFFTEQVASGNDRELYEVLTGQPLTINPDPRVSRRHLEASGLHVVDCREALIPHRFHDIWGVVYYLRVVPWQLPDFTVDRYRPGLKQIADHIARHGAFVAHSRRYLLTAVKP